MTSRVLKGALLAGLALAVVAASAQAGGYHVYTCRTPVGESAPTDGWVGTAAGASVYAEDTCRQGGALTAALSDAKRTANTDIATWGFEAPAGARIAAATLWRAGDADGGAAVFADYAFWFAGPANPNSPTPSNAFARCESGSGCPGGVGNTSQPLSLEN